MRSREKVRRRRREHEENTEGRVVIRSDIYACDGHCSVRSMKTHEQSRRSHLTSPSGRSSRTSSSHHPISGPSPPVFLPLCRSQLQIIGFCLSVSTTANHRILSLSHSPSVSISAANHRFVFCRSRSLSINLGCKSQVFLCRSRSLSVDLGCHKSQAGAIFLKLTEEKNRVLQQNDKLRQELELLRHGHTKSSGGVNLLYIVLVGLIGILMRYFMRKS